MNTSKLFILLFSFIFINNHVLADDFDEITYDQLLNEIQSQKKVIVRQIKSPFDEVKIHAGMGLISSVSNFSIEGSHEQRFQSGLQLMLGIDLFSDDLFAEGVFKNFGTSKSHDESLNIKELDFKIGYKKNLDKSWSYHLTSGLANRLTLLDNKSNNWNYNQITPSLIMGFGLLRKMNSLVNLKFDISGRSALISQTIDKNSIDLTLQLQTEL